MLVYVASLLYGRTMLAWQDATTLQPLPALMGRLVRWLPGYYTVAPPLMHVLCHRLKSSSSSLTLSSRSIFISTRITVAKSGFSRDAVTKAQLLQCNPYLCLAWGPLQHKEINWSINGAICTICGITSPQMTMCHTHWQRTFISKSQCLFSLGDIFSDLT